MTDRRDGTAPEGRSRHDELRWLLRVNCLGGGGLGEEHCSYCRAEVTFAALLDEVAAAEARAADLEEALAHECEVVDTRTTELEAAEARADKATQALEQIADGRNAIALARAALADLARPEGAE